jgi:ABC-type transporter Mla MlaB component
LRITTDVDTSGVAILAVAGRLCADTTDGLAAAITAALRGHQLTRLVVDLARVDIADEAAINVLLHGRDTAYRQASRSGPYAPSTSGITQGDAGALPLRRRGHRGQECAVRIL